MRRFALLGLALLLPGCQFAGNPLDGFGTFVGDTHTYHLNPNAPEAHSENEKRVRGNDVAAAPLEPESGNVWPGPPKPIPTLQDVQKMTDTEHLPPPNIPTTTPPPLFQQDNATPILPDSTMPMAPGGTAPMAPKTP